MAIIQFYHLTTTPFERALPKLLEKAYGANYQTTLLVENETRAEHIDQLLWTYDPASFLPHAIGVDAPIVITSHPPAGSDHERTLLFITNGHQAEETEGYERIIDLFDGNNPIAVEAARTRWKTYKDQGGELTYYKQTEQGGWVKAG